jgi:hypothetical protein
MTRRLLTVLFLLVTLAAKTVPAEEGLGQCVFVVAGPGETAFLSFDRELRSALSSKDAAALALLMRFPLRVNSIDGGSIFIQDPATLQLRFEEVFTPLLRAAVMKQKPQTVFCRDDGIMYGQGELWININGRGKAAHFAVATINVPLEEKKTVNDHHASSVGQVVFTCNADKHRIILDRRKPGEVRYRSWNKPRSPTEPPDMVASGKADAEGTSPCVRAIWTFNHGATTFVLSDLGCTEQKPPAGATGTLEVAVDGESRMKSWCY